MNLRAKLSLLIQSRLSALLHRIMFRSFRWYRPEDLPDEYDGVRDDVGSDAPVEWTGGHAAKLAKAMEYRGSNPAWAQSAQLPIAEDGTVVMELAGMWMQKELPLVKFALVMHSGLEPDDVDEAAKRSLNLWHGLPEFEGLRDYVVKVPE